MLKQVQHDRYVLHSRLVPLLARAVRNDNYRLATPQLCLLREAPPPLHLLIHFYGFSFFYPFSGMSPGFYHDTGFSCSTRRKRVTCVTHSTLGSLALTAGSFLRDITRVLLWMPLSGTLSLCTIFSHSSSHLFKFIFLNKQQYCFINGLRLF